jgi:hypothetical protein
MKIFLPVLLGWLAVCGPPLRAADEKKDSTETSTTTLDQFKLGETIANDPVTMESLKGKVVVLEMWGIH